MLLINVFAVGCDFYFDGLVCWPPTPHGQQATVDCFTIEAFTQAMGILNNYGRLPKGFEKESQQR